MPHTAILVFSRTTWKPRLLITAICLAKTASDSSIPVEIDNQEGVR